MISFIGLHVKCIFEQLDTGQDSRGRRVYIQNNKRMQTTRSRTHTRSHMHTPSQETGFSTNSPNAENNELL